MVTVALRGTSAAPAWIARRTAMVPESSVPSSLGESTSTVVWSGAASATAGPVDITKAAVVRTARAGASTVRRVNIALSDALDHPDAARVVQCRCPTVAALARTGPSTDVVD